MIGAGFDEHPLPLNISNFGSGLDHVVRGRLGEERRQQRLKVFVAPSLQDDEHVVAMLCSSRALVVTTERAFVIDSSWRGRPRRIAALEPRGEVHSAGMVAVPRGDG